MSPEGVGHAFRAVVGGFAPHLSCTSFPNELQLRREQVPKKMALAGRASCHFCFKGKWMSVLDGPDAL